MFEQAKKRAALLAAVSLAVLGGASPSRATTVMWGATIKPPANIIAPEPAKKSDKSKAQKSKPAKTKPVEPKSVRTKSVRTKSAKIKSIETRSANTKPVETTGVSVTRTVTIRTDITPSEAKKPEAEKPAKKSEQTSDKAAKTTKGQSVVPTGPLHIIVSVDAQRASLYANGTFVASTKVSTGTKTHPTPMGVFSVIQKNRHHVSNLYGAPMPYMQRLTWSGTAMHTGPLPGYPASHGCIRLENDFAQLLWKATRIGARVIVTREDVKPVEFSHPQLIVPKPAQERTVETTGALVRTADATATMTMPDTARPADTFEPIARDVVIPPPTSGPSIIDRRISPVSIFISRKEARLYVRQAMQPLFDLPLTLRDPHQPLGTHVFTAMDMKDGAMRWTAVSMPSAFADEVRTAEKAGKNGRTKAASVAAPDPRAALDRIDMPQEVLDRLAGMVTPGSSLIVSDNPLSSETGKYTDFIVLTR